jgi:choline dehydrogenase-like flavoprotein
MPHSDVVVVGAGPTGLFLASELALAGVPVTVLERLQEPDPTIKAGSINVASAEILDWRGLLPAAEEAQRRLVTSVAGNFAGSRTDHAVSNLVDTLTRGPAGSRSRGTSRGCCSGLTWSTRTTRCWPRTRRWPTASWCPSMISSYCSGSTAPGSGSRFAAVSRCAGCAAPARTPRTPRETRT